MPSLSRRRFLQLAAAGGLWPLACDRTSKVAPRSFDIPGTFADANLAERGHLLRQEGMRQWSSFPAVTDGVWDVVVVGGGISGLAACWKLRRMGIERVLLLELAAEIGGTSASGMTAGNAFPWGAHYINIPPPEADCIHEILTDTDVIRGYDAAGRPLVDREHILRWPRERLYQETWTEGLEPFLGASRAEIEVYQQFEDQMLQWMLYRGKDGRKAFAMPLDYSTTDAAVRELDSISMLEYLRAQGWSSQRLDWLVDYACRDDYGSRITEISAWAGIHYYACRPYDARIADAYPSDTLTWPEGNAFLARRLARDLDVDDCRFDTAVVAIRNDRSGCEVACVRWPNLERERVRARSVVYAGKLHSLPHVLDDLPDAQRRCLTSMQYSPWLVAAIHVTSLPGEEQGPNVAWDNILYDSPSLGYVVAGHQRGHLHGAGEVLVYYLPVSESEGRHLLLTRSHAEWVDLIMNDLSRAHPQLEDSVERIDLYRWGHGMVRPVPGSIFGPDADQRRNPVGAVALASCDVTGLPLFEEACYGGVRAAEWCGRRLGASFETSLKGLPHA
jgi:protoporphyrinogen oxidase